MRIDSKDDFLGVPILTIRNFLHRSRRRCGGSVSESFARQVLKFGPEQTREILDELARQGFIEKGGSCKGEQYWQNTIKGNSLSMATAARPVTRAKADQIFAEFMERVQKVNDDPYYLFRVTRVVLFGSYIRDTPTINDIDIALQLAPKVDDLDRRGELYEQRRRESPRNFRNLIDLIGWPMNEVWLFLKSRSRVLSLHDFELDQELLNTIEQKVVMAEEI